MEKNNYSNKLHRFGEFYKTISDSFKGMKDFGLKTMTEIAKDLPPEKQGAYKKAIADFKKGDKDVGEIIKTLNLSLEKLMESGEGNASTKQST